MYLFKLENYNHNGIIRDVFWTIDKVMTIDTSVNKITLTLNLFATAKIAVDSLSDNQETRNSNLANKIKNTKIITDLDISDIIDPQDYMEQVYDYISELADGEVDKEIVGDISLIQVDGNGNEI